MLFCACAFACDIVMGVRVCVRQFRCYFVRACMRACVWSGDVCAQATRVISLVECPRLRVAMRERRLTLSRSRRNSLSHSRTALGSVPARAAVPLRSTCSAGLTNAGTARDFRDAAPNRAAEAERAKGER
eukprot:4968406-Pleurochrysis_carterae.AAC.2